LKFIKLIIRYPTKALVEFKNSEKLRKIQHKKYVYKAVDWEPEKGGDLYTLNNECPAKKWLEIKRDSEVLLVKNLNRSLVNGTKGKVIGFYLSETDEYYYNGEDELLVDKIVLPIVKFINGIVRVINF